MFVPSWKSDPRPSSDGNQPPRCSTPLPLPDTGQPDHPSFPPSPLDPRHDPEQPDEAVPQPTKEDLFECLVRRLVSVESRLVSMGFQPHIAQQATERAEAAAVDAICSGFAQTMTTPGRRAWLHTVARHAALTLLRRKQTVSLPDGDVIPATQGRDEQDFNMILKALKKMPPDLGAVIVDVYVEGLSGREAAERLGIPEATFRRRKALAINRLRTIVDQLSRDS
jgi:RNA polymerase sigma factor (sigma-70 family)